jgi:ribosomal protein L34E
VRGSDDFDRNKVWVIVFSDTTGKRYCGCSLFESGILFQQPELSTNFIRYIHMLLVCPQKSVTLGSNHLIYHRLTLNRCISYYSRTMTDCSNCGTKERQLKANRKWLENKTYPRSSPNPERPYPSLSGGPPHTGTVKQNIESIIQSMVYAAMGV